MRTSLPEDFAIGILGGGQLGMYIAEAAAKLEIPTLAWAPKGDNPAERTATHHLPAEYNDPGALLIFTKLSRVVTLEFENVPLGLLMEIEKRRPVKPSAHVLNIAQDRANEKRFFGCSRIPTNRTALVDENHPPSLFDSTNPKFRFPALLKTRRLGYDGKGQVEIPTLNELHAGWQKHSRVPCILEEKIPFKTEVSVIVARGQGKSIAAYPPIENVHVNGILHQSFCPGPNVNECVAEKATAIAIKIAEELDVIGLIAVEMFVLEDDTVLVNEIAPRPHNSGHGTIDACEVSQYEQLVRAICGFPLGSTTPHSGWIMTNIVGDDVSLVEATLDKNDGLFIHDYGKKECRPGRKMGHYTQLFDLK